jgi:ribosomal protein S18 acetylase RimI-like enzyme
MIIKDDILIREMAKADKPSIIRILEETPSFSKDDVALALELMDIFLNVPGQKDYEMYCAEYNGKVVGYLCFGRSPLTDGTFDLYWIVVDHSMKGKSIGTLLLLKAEEIIKSMDARMMIIETSSGEGYFGTRKFYEKNGYTEGERIKDFYKDGEDRVTFIKRFR